MLMPGMAKCILHVSKIRSNVDVMLKKSLNVFKFLSKSFNNIQHHSRLVAKRVRHVGYNNVE